LFLAFFAFDFFRSLALARFRGSIEMLPFTHGFFLRFLVHIAYTGVFLLDHTQYRARENI